MLLPAARHTLARLLLLALFSNLFVPMAPQASAVTVTAPQPAFPVIAPPAMPRPIASARAPQLDVTPASLAAHAALPPTPRSIGQRLPLTFVPNTSSKVDARVLFQAQGMGGQLFFTQQAVVIALPAPDLAADRPACAQQRDPKHPVLCRLRGNVPPAAVTRLDFVGANAAPVVVGADRLPGVVNHLQGNDRTQWRTQLPTYAGITYQQLYTGIDLRYDGVNGEIKSTYTVAPGADPSRIRWRYQGARTVQVTADGALHILLGSPRLGVTTPLTLTEQAPIAWQIIDGARRAVDVRYSVGVARLVSFTLGSYDRTQPLIIDPTLTYSTYLGGNDADGGTGITVDSAGNAYVVGQTYSTNFITSTNALSSSIAGNFDAFVTKLSPDGQTVLYSTYLGGAADDSASGVVVDADGHIAIIGTTNSSDFPTAGSAQSYGGGSCDFSPYTHPCNDAFVTVLGASGSALMWSTFLGGSHNDDGVALAVDPSGNVYVTGDTASSDFLTSPGAYDTTCNTVGTCISGGELFAAKLSHTDGTRSWSTFLGGSDFDGAGGIAVDATGHAYVAGSTASTDFLPASPRPSHTAGGISDAFVLKLTTDGSDLVYGTYLGGSASEGANGIAVDQGGNAYVTGETNSYDFPLAPAGKALQSTFVSFGGGETMYTDLFVTKLNPTGNTLIYSTYLGGNNEDSASGIALDRAGRATVVGYTASTDFFHAPNNFPTQCGEAPFCNDAFIATLTTNGRALRFGSYLGGDAWDSASAVAEDGGGNLFITGSTDSGDFRTANPAQGSHGGGFGDAFVAKISNPSIGPDEQRCHCGLSQPATNSPVNTRTGNYWTSTTDLSVLTPGPAISWSRVYASQAITDTTGALSPGWQYPYAAHIITPTIELGRVIVLSGMNNRERFTVRPSSYEPFPGVSSTLVRAGGVFTQTLRDQ